MRKSNLDLKFLMLIIPFFKHTGFSQVSFLSKIFDAWFVAASAVIIYEAFKNRYKPPKFIMVCGVLQFYMFANTVIQGGFSTNLLRNTFGVLLLLILIDMYLKINRIQVYKNLNVLMFVYSLFNFIIPKGTLFPEYLFGARTNLTTVATPIVMISVFILLCDTKMKGNYKMVFMTAVTACTNLILIFKESVSTAIVTIAVSAVFYLMLNFSFFRKVKSSVYIIGSIIYVFIIVIFQSFGYLKAIFNLLGENMTMTGRLLIWTNTVDLIEKSPIFGYGVDMLMVSRGGYSLATTYVHNNFLQFCMDGGIIALVLFIGLLLVTVKDTGKLRTKQSRLVLAMNIGFIIGMISEAFTSRNFYYVLLLLMANQLDQANNVKKLFLDDGLF